MLNVWCRHADGDYILISPDEEDNYREVFRIYVEDENVAAVFLSAYTYTEKEIFDDLGYVLLTDQEVREFVKEHGESLEYFIRRCLSSKFGLEL